MARGRGEGRVDAEQEREKIKKTKKERCSSERYALLYVDNRTAKVVATLYPKRNAIPKQEIRRHRRVLRTVWKTQYSNCRKSM